MAGNSNSGRKPKTLTRERAIQSLTQRLPKAVRVIGETVTGQNKDRLRYEAAVQVKDSVMGKPKQSIELEGGEDIGANQLVALFKLDSERQYIIDQYYLEHPEIIRPEWYTVTAPVQLPASCIEIYEPSVETG